MKKKAICLIILLITISPCVLGEGVTIIVHGFHSGTDDWVNEMKDAIENRYSESPNIAWYTITAIDEWGNTDIQISGRNGIDPLTVPNCNIVLLLDWSDADGEFDVNKSVIDALAPKLLDSTFAPGLGKALVELPIHLIGHSRGGSLVCGLAKELGQAGVVVDQVTTLDPRPVSGDAPLFTYGNVLFADSYYQYMGVVTGMLVPGAYNRELTSFEGGYGSQHSDVHLWYHGTIDLNTPITVDDQPITSTTRSDWWDSPESSGATAGYYYSRIGGGDRLSDAYAMTSAGYGTAYGGPDNIARVPVNTDNAVWPNVYDLEVKLDGNSLEGDTHYLSVGDVLELEANLKVFGSGTVSFYLDADKNPYNGIGFLIGSESFVSNSSFRTHTWNISSGMSGSEGYVCAKVSGEGSLARYSYASPRLVFGNVDPDINGDGVVNLLDYSILANGWMISPCFGPSWCSGADVNRSGSVGVEDLFVLSENWTDEDLPKSTGMIWVSIDDPGVTGHEDFVGQMSKYETTNTQYCEFLNAAIVSGDITVAANNSVYGAYGSNAGADFVGKLYYWTYEGMGITYADGIFEVSTRDGHHMGNHPVIMVTWYGAEAFCNYYGYRLPSEWEWQAVADYDGNYNYGCGPTIDLSKANCWDGNETLSNPLNFSSSPYTSPVGYYPSYGYGLNGMTGNVQEWTSPGVVNGGYYYSWTGLCTVSTRSHPSPSGATNAYGFRACRKEQLGGGLVAHYKLDNISGVVVDETGNYDGINDGATRGVTGKVGYAFEFDGVSNGVNLQAPILPTIPNADYSIAAWIYLDSYHPSVGRCFFSQYIYPTPGRYGIAIAPDKKLGDGYAYSTQDIPLQQWVFIAITRKNGIVKNFINAVQDGIGVNTSAILDAEAYLGNLNPADNNYRWDGKIDEVKIWNRALSASEVQSLYQNP